jgi:hypothetical protein
MALVKKQVPSLLFENEIAVKIYNAIISYNSDINWAGFQYFLELYEIDDIEYYTDAMILIKHSITDAYKEIDNKKEKGKSINEKAMEMIKAKGLFGGN